MFDLSVGKMLVLLIIGLLVLGPDRLPTLAKDAARLLRSLHEIATGARQQLQAELGPELADIDLRSLHPRTVLQDAVSGEKLDTAKRDRAAHRAAIVADEQPNGTTPPAGISGPTREPGIMLDAGVDLRDTQVAARHDDRRTTCATTMPARTSTRHPHYILAVCMSSSMQSAAARRRR